MMKMYQFKKKKEKKKVESAHPVRVYISEKKNINYVLLLQKR